MRLLLCVLIMTTLTDCKTLKTDSQLSEDSAQGRYDWLIEVNAVSQYALQGGAIVSAMNLVQQADAGIAQKFDTLIAKSPSNFARIRSEIIKARTLRQLNDRRYIEGVGPIADLIPMCEFALPCLGTLTDIAEAVELDPGAFRNLLSPESPLKFSIARIRDQPFVREIVLTQFELIAMWQKLLELHGGTLHDPLSLGKPYIGAQALNQSTQAIAAEFVKMATQKIAPLLNDQDQPLSDQTFVNRVIGRNIETIKDEQMRQRIQKAAAKLHAHLILAYETAMQFAYIAQRLTLPIDQFNEQQITSVANAGMGRAPQAWEIERRKLALARALTFDSSREATLATRYLWADAVQRVSINIDSDEWTNVTKVTRGLVQAHDAMIKNFVDNDPYLKKSNILSSLLPREIALVRTIPQFHSVFYRVIDYVRRQNDASSLLAKSNMDAPVNDARNDNRLHAIDRVHESYLFAVCAAQGIQGTGAQLTFTQSNFSSFKLAPPIECPASEQFDRKLGSFATSKLAGGERCASHMEALTCPVAPAEAFTQSLIVQHVHQRRLKVVWAPVIRQAIVVSVVAVSIFATAGLSSAAGVGYLGAGVAGVLRAGASTALYARASATVLNAVISGVGFTVVNNLALVATGVKSLDNPQAFAAGFAREAVFASALMLVMPLADPLILAAGEKAAAITAYFTVRETAREFAKRSAIALTDSAVFLPVAYVQRIINGVIDGKSRSDIEAELAKTSLREELLSGILFALSMQVRRQQLNDDFSFTLAPAM